MTIITGPILDSAGQPANGYLYLRQTSRFTSSDGLVTQAAYTAEVVAGVPLSADRVGALQLIPSAESTALEIVEDFRDGKTTRLTVAVPALTTMTYAELVSSYVVVPATSGGEFVLPPWVSEILGARDQADAAAASAALAQTSAEAAETGAIEAAGEAASSATAAAGFASDAEAAAAAAVAPTDTQFATLLDDPLSETSASLNSTIDTQAVVGAMRGDPARRFRIVSGVLRNDGAGWYVLDDAAHRATGVESVETRIDSIRVHFSGATAGKVVACIPKTSSALERAGIVPGQSIGLDYVDIPLIQRPFQLADRIYYNAGTSAWVSENGVFTLSWNAAGRLAINHLAVPIPTVSDRYDFQALPRGGKYLVSLASSTTVGNAIRTDGVSVEFRTALGAAQVTTQDAEMDFMFSRRVTKSRTMDPAEVTTVLYPFANISFVVFLED